MILQILPHDNYRGLPCSIVAAGCALGYTEKKDILTLSPSGIHPDGYLPLEPANRFIRSLLPVKKRITYKRGERPHLWEFLCGNESKALVCVFGHLIYVDGESYYSFFNNLNDDIVCIWILS